VAEQFVAAVDTTSPAEPAGDTATEAALAPTLAVPHIVSWPAAWTAEHRTTTVVLDPPGVPLLLAGGQVAVIVTGTMLVTSGTTTSDSAPPAEVPVAEKVTLRSTSDGQSGGSWMVTDVEAGS
jgi:hypothetical protein